MFAAAQPAAPHSDPLERIQLLRQQRNAVILAHYYQEEAIQDIADFIGDSLELSRKAASTDADVIVFCGVHFMAETAKILSPEKIVVLPDLNAGCSLADACPPDAFAEFRSDHPDHVVISYINCSAAIKAQSDLICTSSNAVAMVQSIPEDTPILFAPIATWGAGSADRPDASSLFGREAASCTRPSASKPYCSSNRNTRRLA